MKKKINKNKISKKIITIVLGFVILLVFLLIIKNKKGDNQNTYNVQSGTVSDELVFAGIIEAEKRVDLGFAVGGRISKVNFKEGDFVKEGQVIAELDQNTLRSDLIQANANYTLTRVDVNTSLNEVEDSYETTLDQQNILVEGTLRQYISGDLEAFLNDENTSRNAVAPTISGNYSSEQEGTYKLEIYGSSSNSGFSYRLSGLEKGTYSGEINQPGKFGDLGLYIQFDDDSNYINTEWIIEVPNTRSSTYLSRKTTYENALASRDLVLNTVENNREKVLATDTQTNISRSQAQINNARAQVNSVYSKFADGTITAPFNGYIMKNDLEVGETINAFEVSIILFENHNKKLVLNTPEIYINKINLEDFVSIRLDAYPDILFEGGISHLDSIDTLVDGVPVYETEVTFLKEDKRLRVGMNAHANIIVSQKEDVITIPQHFIKTENGVSKVTVLDPEKNKTERIITIGLIGNNGLVEILSGLKINEIIILEEK